MNDYFKEAERNLIQAHTYIGRLVCTKDNKEDLSYFNHPAIDEILRLVIKAKTLMGMGRLEDEHTATKETVR